MGEEPIITAAYLPAHTEEAAALVSIAIEEVNRGAPYHPKHHALRKERAGRFHKAFVDHSALIDCVAQWLSAKESARSVTEASKYVKRVHDITDEIERLRQQIDGLSQALRFERTSPKGHDMAGNAQVVAASLKEALAPLGFAREIAGEMLAEMPKDASGCKSIVGALREGPTNVGLAVALAEIWHFKGLNVDGGEDAGDGIDIFLASLIGNKRAETALTAARKFLSSKNRPP